LTFLVFIIFPRLVVDTLGFSLNFVKHFLLNFLFYAKELEVAAKYRIPVPAHRKGGRVTRHEVAGVLFHRAATGFAAVGNTIAG
jgi:hypothetical protein